MTDEPRFEELGDVEELPEEDEPEEELWEPHRLEPEGATRNSPHAIAALVAAVLSAFPLVQGYANFGAYFPDFGPVDVTRIARVMIGLLPTIGFAVAAWWLAGRADEEIYVAEGRLGGVGYARAARVIAAVAGVGLIGLTTLNLVVRNDPSDFGIESEVEFPDDSDGGVEFRGPAPPSAPAVPVP
jgi:hypothetical protein